MITVEYSNFKNLPIYLFFYFTYLTPILLTFDHPADSVFSNYSLLCDPHQIPESTLDRSDYKLKTTCPMGAGLGWCCWITSTVAQAPGFCSPNTSSHAQALGSLNCYQQNPSFLEVEAWSLTWTELFLPFSLDTRILILEWIPGCWWHFSFLPSTLTYPCWASIFYDAFVYFLFFCSAFPYLSLLLFSIHRSSK